MIKWRFCEDCKFDGHCQNQDSGHKCECYAKQLEDKLDKCESDIKYYCIQNERYAIALKNASNYLRKHFPKIAEQIYKELQK